jgi:hypothetical protein
MTVVILDRPNPLAKSTWYKKWSSAKRFSEEARRDKLFRRIKSLEGRDSMSTCIRKRVSP